MSLNYSIAMLRNPQKPDEDAKAYRTGEKTGNFKGSYVSEGQCNLKENAENV